MIWNISEHNVGTEELGHLEMIGTIVYQLTKGLSTEELMQQGFSDYFVEHTTGVYLQTASGSPYTADMFNVKGDLFADLNENLAADATTAKEQPAFSRG